MPPRSDSNIMLQSARGRITQQHVESHFSDFLHTQTHTCRHRTVKGVVSSFRTQGQTCLFNKPKWFLDRTEFPNICCVWTAWGLREKHTASLANVEILKCKHDGRNSGPSIWTFWRKKHTDGEVVTWDQRYYYTQRTSINIACYFWTHIIINVSLNKICTCELVLLSHYYSISKSINQPVPQSIPRCFYSPSYCLLLLYAHAKLLSTIWRSIWTHQPSSFALLIYG